MITPPPGRWQPPLLARPAHGLLARHGWIWMAGPGAVLFVSSVIVTGLIGPTHGQPDGVLAGLAGVAFFIGSALLIVGLPLRVLLVHRHRRQWAAGAALPTLTGRYPTPAATAGVPAGPGYDAGPTPPPHYVGKAVGFSAFAVLIGLIALAVAAFLAVLGVTSLTTGIQAQLLQHSSSTVRVTATLDKGTTVFRGRGTSYTDRVSYTVAGHNEHNVEIDADRAQRAGHSITVLVDPQDPGTAIGRTDHGYGPLLLGAGLLALFLAESSPRSATDVDIDADPTPLPSHPLRRCRPPSPDRRGEHGARQCAQRGMRAWPDRYRPATSQNSTESVERSNRRGL